MNRKFSLLLVPAILLGSCNSGGGGTKTEHVHKYDVENIDWCFVPSALGGYSASATFSCLECSETTKGHEVEVPAGVTTKIEEPTCLEAGAKIYTATVHFEEKDYSSEKREIINPKGHHFDEEVWVSDETSHYHKCVDCDEKKDAEEHKTLKDIQFDGVYHWYECAVCEGVYNKEVHTLENIIRSDRKVKDATCYNELTYHKTCSLCGAEADATFTVPDTMTVHQFVHHDAVKAKSCTKTGNKEYWTCTICGDGYYFDTNQDVHAQPVSWESLVTRLSHEMHFIGAKDPSCDEVGWIDHYECAHESEVYYKDNEGKEKYTSEEVLIPMLGHNFLIDGTCLNECEKTIKDVYQLTNTTSPVPGTNEIVLVNDDGTIYGKKSMSSGSIINVPTSLIKEGYTFLGWFDGNGNEVKDGDSFTSATALTARFIENQENMFVPSDFGYSTKSWALVDGSASQKKTLQAMPENANRLDMYLMYDATHGVSSGDTYISVGFPCGGVIAETLYIRLMTRNNYGSPAGSQIKAFFYGGSLGNASTPTMLDISYKGNLLIHLYMINNEGSLTGGYEVISMVNGNKATATSPITIAGYNMNDVNKNMLEIDRTQDKTNTMIKDAF